MIRNTSSKVDEVLTPVPMAMLRCIFNGFGNRLIGAKGLTRAHGEIPEAVEVTDDSKWDDMDENATHLTLADGVLSSIEELKTPMEMWTGKPFLGYADGVKGYHLWDPTAHKVVVNGYVVFMEDKIQENEEGDSTTRETTSIQMEKEFQSNDSFEAAPEHEVNETNESQAPATRTLNRERKRPGWHLDYVMESNVEVETPLEINGYDQVERYRERLVVKGYAQKEGIDFNEIF
ncbi:hypothetical protein Tco_0916590 [Tanacetum coccineum]